MQKVYYLSIPHMARSRTPNDLYKCVRVCARVCGRAKMKVSV